MWKKWYINPYIDLEKIFERQNLLDNKRFTELDNKYSDENKEDKCEVIDIANKEMENIDSSKIDFEFKKVFIGEMTKNLLNLVSSDNFEEKDVKSYINSYLENLNDNDILDIRISGKNLYIKTRKNIIPLSLSKIMEIDEQCIEEIPITGKYNFYLINCEKWSSINLSKEENSIPYNPDDLVDILMDIGGDCIGEDLLTCSQLFSLIKTAFNENWYDMPEDISIKVEVEDKVVAIALDQFIADAKDVLSEALFLNPKIFIEVSTPIGTVLLIDTRRWYLEPNFGGEEWFQ